MARSDQSVEISAGHRGSRSALRSGVNLELVAKRSLAVLVDAWEGVAETRMRETCAALAAVVDCRLNSRSAPLARSPSARPPTGAMSRSPSPHLVRRAGRAFSPRCTLMPVVSGRQRNTSLIQGGCGGAEVSEVVGGGL